MIRKFLSGNVRDVADAVAERLGQTDKVPDSHVMALNIAYRGSVHADLYEDGGLSFDDFLKLADAHPEDFALIRRKVDELTALGQSPN
ncbi:MAG: hypothetical protein HQK58_10325 [Deltaproteobacteria bacterium]|nr:hypothetical protein [Deltaproteobacteria bacterium]